MTERPVARVGPYLFRFTSYNPELDVLKVATYEEASLAEPGPNDVSWLHESSDSEEVCGLVVDDAGERLEKAGELVVELPSGVSARVEGVAELIHNGRRRLSDAIDNLREEAG